MVGEAGTVALLVAVAGATAARGESFTRDVAPLLVRRCGGCHVTGRKGDFQMASYAALMASGVVQRGAAASSRIVEVIASGDMPRGGGRVTPAELAALSKWIDAGAAFDAADPAARLDRLAMAAGPGAGSEPTAPPPPRSPAELAAARRAAAPAAWVRALPDEEPVIVDREALTLVGNLPASRMEGLAGQAEELERRLRTELASGTAPLAAGGANVYLFRVGPDYSAFWQEVERRERPRGLQGHAGRKGDVAYAALLVPPTDDDNLDARLLLAEQIAGAALAGRGLPDWFARGAARATAVRLVPQAELARAWRQGVPAAVAEVGTAADFLAGRGDAAAAAVVAGGFVGALAPSAAKLRACLAAVDRGQPFEAAFTGAFRGGPAPLYEAWAARESRRRSAGR
jgi:hypothetical protein